MPANDAFTKIVARRLGQHATVEDNILGILDALPHQTRNYAPGEDILSQGEKPTVSVGVLAGMVGRYHTLASGHRQFLSFHIAGDFPDLQALFLAEMDHSLCAIDDAEVALISHETLVVVFEASPALGLLFWRETLADAAIFRQWITNNSLRSPVERLAHFFCEQLARATAAGLNRDDQCRLPLSQSQIGEALGMSLISVSRALRALRGADLAEIQNGVLTVRDWPALVERAGFDPSYLHLKE